MEGGVLVGGRAVMDLLIVISSRIYSLQLSRSAVYVSRKKNR